MNVTNDYQNAGYGSAQGGGFGPGGFAFGGAAYGDPVASALSALTHANSTDLIRDVAENKLAVAQTSAELAAGTTDTGWVISEQLRDLTRDVIDSRVQLKDQLVGVTYEMSREFRGIDDRLCNFEKDSIKNFYENKVKMLEIEGGLHKEIATSRYLADKQTVASEIAISNKIVGTEILLNREIVQSRYEADKKMDTLLSKFEECCCDLKQQAIQTKLESTQDELNELRFSSSTNAILAAINGGVVATTFGKQ